MIIVRIAISVRGNVEHTIEVTTLEGIDANRTEREVAEIITTTIREAMEQLRDELPAGRVDIRRRFNDP